MIRLGFGGRVVGKPALASPDEAMPATHLSLALARLGDTLSYLERLRVRFYRLRLAFDLRCFYEQLAECTPLLDILAERIAVAGIRLGLHLPPGLDLGHADDAAAALALAEVEAAALLLSRLDAKGASKGPESVVVAHLGAIVSDERAEERFLVRYHALSPQARARLALEHGHAGPSLGRLLMLHQRCGAPIVFDMLHWELYNPEALPLPLALGLALATWPSHMRPEVHLSSQRSEAHLLPPHAGAPARVLPPRPGQHADFVAVGDLERLLRAANGLPPFDLLLEAKAGDLALLRLRTEIARRAPRLAARLG